ncbi:hypothetical protein D3C81_410520 [compost metagenome]|jgi:hypothetical protein
MADELYTGPDRGHFRTIRLLDNSGVQLRANCRIKDATVFNYLSDLQYAIVGYTIEWWPEGQPAPHLGGDANPYIPRQRPGITKLYFRTKGTITSKLLYLEDAIVNDFLNNKVLAEPMSLLSFAQESAEQVASSATWRLLQKSPWDYANAVHITKYEAGANTPLTLVQEGLRFDWRLTGRDDQMIQAQLSNYPFAKLRDCYPAMQTYLEGINNGGN